MSVKKRKNKLEGAEMPLVEETEQEQIETEGTEPEVETQPENSEVESTDEEEAKFPEEVEPELPVEPVVAPEPELPVVEQTIVPEPEVIKQPELPVEIIAPEQAAVTIEAFDKKSINALILGYENIQVDDLDTGVFNTVENKKARELIRLLSEAAAGTEHSVAIKTLAHLSIFMLDVKKEKDSGLLFQLLVQDFNNAKDINEIDMSIFILSRLFKNVKSFSFNVMLKGIAQGYHPDFKVHALQMHEVFRQLSTKAERDMKIDKTISFANKKDGRGKAFAVSNVFLNQNGSKLLTQYFTEK